MKGYCALYDITEGQRALCFSTLAKTPNGRLFSLLGSSDTHCCQKQTNKQKTTHWSVKFSVTRRQRRSDTKTTRRIMKIFFYLLEELRHLAHQAGVALHFTFVPVGQEEVSQQRRVCQRLHDAVHEAGVAQVDQTSQACGRQTERRQSEKKRRKNKRRRRRTHTHTHTPTDCGHKV